MDGDRIALRHGALTCLLAPGCGGSIARLALDRGGGRIDLMRPAPDRLSEPLDAACFPLVPFSNRIALGRFAHRGREVRLPANAPLPHAIHGHGWLAPWRVEEAGPDSALLSYRHEADAWPFPYRARQGFALSEDGLTVTMELTNEGDEPMPAGLGLHPYFPRPEGTRLQAGVSSVWLPDAAMIPETNAPPPPEWDLARGIAVEGAGLDHGFADWIGDAAIDWPGLGLRLRIRADDLFGHLVVYAPPGEPWFCVEPASHMTDAVNRAARGEGGTGFREVPPGATLGGRVRFSVEAPPA
jgi:aldose 1-epimerase